MQQHDRETPCVSRDIVRGDTPGSVVAAGLADISGGEGHEMIDLARRIAAAQRAEGLAQGVNLFLTDGEVAGQEVFHAHLHVLARRTGDGMSLGVDCVPAPSRAAPDGTAARLEPRL